MLTRLNVPLGGFLGYHLAKDRASEHAHGWGSGRAWGRCQQQYQQTASASGIPVQSTSEKASQQSLNVTPAEYAQFQEWKQQQSFQSGERSAFPSYAHAPAYNVEAVKASAVESADKALDVILSQVQGMKEVGYRAFQP